MNPYSRFFIPLVALAAILFGCDASEDPRLLNPPLPDSTRVRIVNLLPSGQVDVAIPGITIVQGLGSMQVSSFSNVLVPELTQVIVRRTTPVRFDTAFNQTLSPDSRLTYLILGNNDTTRIIGLGTGTQEETDLRTANEARIGFINAVDDSATYSIRVGCHSGSELFNSTSFAGTPQTVNTKSRELSLYLFSSRDSLPITSARLDTEIGTVSYIIAARINGRIGLYRVTATTSATPLIEVPIETRTTASVELLNALPDGRSVSARMQGGSTFATGVPSLTISPSQDVDACVNPTGDQLIVEPQGRAELLAPISLSVGSRALVVVHTVDTSSENGTRALVLSRDLPTPTSDSVYIRGVNVATTIGRASISIGAGAPAPINADFRPFGTLGLGVASGYVRVPRGSYPFMLSSAETGRFFGGGIEELEPGYYTLLVVDDGGTPSLRIVRDDVPNSPLRTLRSSGSRVTFFNVMPDAHATFTAGSRAFSPLPYSYVYSTIVPYDVTSIGSNAGNVTVDLVAGGYTIGTTGVEGSRRMIAFRAPMDVLPAKTTAIRFLNAVHNSPELVVRIGASNAAPVTSLPFAEPTPQTQLEARKYSLFITSPQDTITRARADGVELLAGRHYLLVVAPKREGNTSKLDYEVFWVQE